MKYTITHMHYRGEGIALDESGRQIRIANALTGETVEAQDVSIMRRRQAKLTQVIAAASERRTPPCPHWDQCHACQFQCIDLQVQSQLKRESWLSLIHKIVPESKECNILFHQARKLFNYRHKAELVVFARQTPPVLGIAPRLDAAAAQTLQYASDHGHPLQLTEMEPADLYALEQYIPVPLKDCLLHAPELNALITAVENLLALDSILPHQTALTCEAYQNNARVIIHAKPEVAESSRQAAQILCEKLTRDFPNLTLILQILPPRGSHVYPPPEAISNTPWYGYANDLQNHLLYALKGAWTPVNPENAALIRDTLVQMIQDRTFHTILELGCGCGTHTAVFAPHAQQYIGIDASWPAIQSAQYNAQQYQWENAQFFTDTAEHFLQKRYKKGLRADVILMHSNRMPYSEKTAALCLQFGAKDIYIVAPTAYAMAQECRHFIDLGLKLCQIVICDTLPMTYHGMAVAHLTLG